MTIETNETKQLSALAVFGVLSHTRTDIFDVLKSFISYVIKEEKLTCFTANEMAIKLNKHFDFDLPDAVVETAARRFKFRVDYGTYYIEKAVNGNSSQVEENIEKFSQNYEDIFNNLEIFTNTKLNETLSKETLTNAFTSFFLNKRVNTEQENIISTFLLNHEERAFADLFNTTTEGAILYSGLQYTEDNFDFGNWSRELSVILDTEILFSAAGLNGDLLKNSFDELYSFMKKINNKSIAKYKRPLIRLYIVPSVQLEYRNYFDTAEMIIRKQQVIDYSKSAMEAIVRSCKDVSDVQIELAKFESIFSKYNIEIMEEPDLVDAVEYNLIDENMVSFFNKELDVNDSYRFLKMLNLVNLLRAGKKSRTIEKAEYILLTAKSNTLAIAFHEKVKNIGEASLATTVSYLTSLFWYRLGEGFSKNELPKSLSIYTKARIALAGVVNDSLSSKYKELCDGYTNGNLSSEQAVAGIAKLKEKARKPEDFDADLANEAFAFISEGDITKYVKEKEYLQMKNEEQSSLIEQLQNSIENIQNQQQEEKRNYESILQEQTRSQAKTTDAIQDELKKQKSINEKQGKQLQHLLNSDKKRKKRNLAFILFILFAVFAYFTFYLYKHNKDTFAYITGSSSVLIPLAIYIIHYFKTRDNV